MDRSRAYGDQAIKFSAQSLGMASHSSMLLGVGQAKTVGAKQKVITGCFVAGLLTIAVIAGTFSYFLTQHSEKHKFESDYNILMNNAVILLQNTINSRVRGLKTISLVMENAFPAEHQWPNAYLKGYNEIAGSLSSLGPIYSAPIVHPDEADDFEDFDSYNKT